MLGVIKDSRERFLGKRSWEFEVQDQGWRYHMSNIMVRNWKYTTSKIK